MAFKYTLINLLSSDGPDAWIILIHPTDFRKHGDSTQQDLNKQNSYFKVSPESFFCATQEETQRKSKSTHRRGVAATEKKKHMAFFGSSSGSSNKQIDTHNMEHQQNPDEVSSCFHARSIELLRAILELLEGFEFTQNVVTVATTTTIITTCGTCKYRNIVLAKSWSKIIIITCWGSMVQWYRNTNII